MRRYVASVGALLMLAACTSGNGSDTPPVTRITSVGVSATTSTPGSASTSTSASAPLPTTPPSADGEIHVSDPGALRAAIEAAGPGDVIQVADGEYRFDDRLVAAAIGNGGRTDHAARDAGGGHPDEERLR